MIRRPRTLFLALVTSLALLATGCAGLANPEGWAAPAFDGDVVYVFGDDDRLSALDRETGDVLWIFPDDRDPEQDDIELNAIYAQPVVTDTAIYIAGFESGLYALDPADGSTIWEFNDISGDVVGTPAFADGRLFVGTTEGRLYAINTAEGELAAEWPQGGAPTGDPVWSSVLLHDDNVIIATMRGAIEAFSAADGSRIEGWGFEADGAVADLALINGDTIFAPSFDRHVYLLDAATGQPIQPDGYRTRGWVWQQPAVDDNAVYFGDLEGGVYALDLATGDEIWSAEVGGAPKIKAAPAIVDGTLVVVDRDASVSFYDTETGTPEGRSRLDLRGGTVRAQLQVEDGGVYFVTTRGHLWRIDPADQSAVEITGEEEQS